MGNEDNSLPLFTTLVAGLFSIVVIVFVIGFAIANFRSTADIVVQLSTSGVSRIQTLASSLVSQAFVIIQSAAPEIEQTASSIGTTVIGGVASTLNAVLSVGNSVIQSVVGAFVALAGLLRDFGKQLVETFLASMVPTFRNIEAALSNISQMIGIIGELFNSIAQIINEFISVFGSLSPPDFDFSL